jgi:DNA-binding LacI/PurR family transcriptional regulator
LISNQAAGIAVFGGVVDRALIRPGGRGTNLVFVGPENVSSLDQEPYPSTISADDGGGMDMAVAEGLRLGYRKFGYIDGPGVASNVRRRSTAASALQAAGVDRLRIYKSRGDDFTVVARRLIQDHRDLVLCFDDQRALKLLSALTKLGARVPDDLGIIGFDDIPFASISNPPLSTVSVPYEVMGQMACSMLLEQLAKGAASDFVSLPVRLVLRSTTATRNRLD